MAGDNVRSAASGERLQGLWDSLRTSFGLPAGVTMLLAAVAGFGMPVIDDVFGVEIPLLAFDTQDAARSMLQTIATVTVAVAGLAFSVTVVAFTLSSSQLSPRVLRSFRADRLSQIVLGLFLGTFVYCLSVLARLGTAETTRVPNLSVTIAVLLAFVAFALFAAFIAHITTMLEPSSVIARIASDASKEVKKPYPAGVGNDPEHPGAARAAARGRMESDDPMPLRATRSGYLTLVRGGAIVETAARHDALVRQRISIGDYVLAGDTLAEVWGADRDDADDLMEALLSSFEFGDQRSLVHDLGFPVRQLADIGLKGLSPGINDPTTAENAMNTMAALLVRFARAEHACEVRVDGDGRARLVTLPTHLDDLVRLGFDQVRVFAAPYPMIQIRLLELLEGIARAAREAGLDHGEVARQARLVREGPVDEVPTSEDVDAVRRVHDSLRGRSIR